MYTIKYKLNREPNWKTKSFNGAKSEAQAKSWFWNWLSNGKKYLYNKLQQEYQIEVEEVNFNVNKQADEYRKASKGESMTRKKYQLWYASYKDKSDNPKTETDTVIAMDQYHARDKWAKAHPEYRVIMVKFHSFVESKVNQNFDQTDTWRTTILNSVEDKDSVQFKIDETNNQELAIQNEAIIGIFDSDLKCGTIVENNEQTFSDQESWMQSLGSEPVTIDQDDEGQVVVAKNAQGQIIGTYATVNGQGKGVRVEASYNELAELWDAGNLVSRRKIAAMANVELPIDDDKLNITTWRDLPKKIKNEITANYTGPTDVEFALKLMKENSGNLVFLGRDRATWVDDNYNAELFSKSEAEDLASKLGGTIMDIGDSDKFFVVKRVLEDDSDNAAGIKYTDNTPM